VQCVCGVWWDGWGGNVVGEKGSGCVGEEVAGGCVGERGGGGGAWGSSGGRVGGVKGAGERE